VTRCVSNFGAANWRGESPAGAAAAGGLAGGGAAQRGGRPRAAALHVRRGSRLNVAGYPCPPCEERF